MVPEQRVLRQYCVGHRCRLEDLLPQADERPRPGAGVDARRHHPRADDLQPARQLDVGQEPAADGARRDDPGRQDHSRRRSQGICRGPVAPEAHVHADQPGDRAGLRELCHGSAACAVRQGHHVQRRPSRHHHAEPAPAGAGPGGRHRQHQSAAVSQRDSGCAGRTRPDLQRDRRDGGICRPQQLWRPVQPGGLAAPQPGLIDEDLHVHGRDRERSLHHDDTDRGQPDLNPRRQRHVEAAEL